MASVQELIGEVSSIKQTSDELVNMVSAAGSTLNQQANAIGALVRGSRTGQEAVMTVGIAARSLSVAAASMKSLSRMCDNYIRGVSQ